MCGCAVPTTARSQTPRPQISATSEKSVWCRIGRGKKSIHPSRWSPRIRAVLEGYAVGGGSYREEIFTDCGHTPHSKCPMRFDESSSSFSLESAPGRGSLILYSSDSASTSSRQKPRMSGTALRWSWHSVLPP